MVEIASAHAAGSLARFDHPSTPFIDADIGDEGSPRIA